VRGEEGIGEGGRRRQRRDCKGKENTHTHTHAHTHEIGEDDMGKRQSVAVDVGKCMELRKGDVHCREMYRDSRGRTRGEESRIRGMRALACRE